MLEIMERSSGSNLGFRVIGTVTKADYETLDPVVGAAIREYGTINLLFDLSRFHWEKASAWSSDFNFGKAYKDGIGKMALVANAKWIKPLATVAEPFYANDVKSFETEDGAWDWITS